MSGLRKLLLGIGLSLAALTYSPKSYAQEQPTPPINPVSLEAQILQYLQENPGSRLFDITVLIGSSDEARNVLASLLEANQIRIRNNQLYSITNLNLPRTQRLAGEIAFQSDRDGNWEIYTMNPDGTMQINQTRNSAHDIDPAFSPNGREIVFSSNRDGDYEIFVKNLLDNTVRKLTNNSVSDRNPAWSPDGTHIIYDSGEGNKRDIYKMNSIDGSEKQNLTNDNEENKEPSWSLRGGKVVYIRDNLSHICIINVIGGVRHPGGFDSVSSSPVWSPNSTEFVYSRGLTGSPKCIYTRNPNESGKKLTTDHYDSANPSWSPDGNLIIHDSDRTGDYEIYTMRADGSNIRRLTDNPANDRNPSWSPR